jgi:hypothetical protein
MEKVIHAHTKHHRRCRSNGGKTTERNISMVPEHKHRAYHLLFANMDAHEIANLLTRVYIDPDWEMIARRKGHSQD